VLRLHELAFLEAVEEAGERIPEAIHVHQRERPVVELQLAHRDVLRELLERAEAAGKREEDIRVLDHRHAPLLQILRHHELVRVVVGEAALVEEPGDDGQDATAGLLHGDGEGVHGAGVPAAEHEVVLALSQKRAEPGGDVDVLRVHPVAGRAVDTDVHGFSQGVLRGGPPTYPVESESSTGGFRDFREDARIRKNRPLDGGNWRPGRVNETARPAVPPAEPGGVPWKRCEPRTTEAGPAARPRPR